MIADFPRPPEPDIDEALRFLDLLDPGAGFFALASVGDRKQPGKDPWAKRLAVPRDKCPGGWMTRANQNGAGVFLTVSATDGRGFKDANIVRVRAVFADLDGTSPEPVRACALEPHIIVESSPGRFHAYWLCDLPLDQFTSVQRAIAARFGGDPGVADLPRVMRLPGFIHQKGEPFRTRIIEDTARPPYSAEEVLSEFPPAAKTNGAAGERDYQQGEGTAELTRRIVTGESYYPSLRDLSFRFVCDGLDSGTIVEMLRGMMNASTGPRDDRWKARFEAIQGLVDSAQDKVRPPVTVDLSAFEPTQQCEKSEESEKSPNSTGYAAKEAPQDAKKGSGWPDPLGEAAFHGPAGDFVRAILPQTESSAVALLVQFLAAFGNVIGRSAYLQVEEDKHYAQLWPVLVGRTSKARKGTSYGRVMTLFKQADPVWAAGCVVKGGLSSGEGVIWAVRDKITKMVTDKKSGATTEEIVDYGVADKRLLVFEPELANVFKQFERSGNNLSAVLRMFWDDGNVRSLVKNSPAAATGAMLAACGHITLGELRRVMTVTEAGNGLANRFVFFMSERSKSLPFGGEPVDLDELAEVVKARAHSATTRRDPRVLWAARAKRIWEDAYARLSEGGDGMFGAITSRAEAQTLRLALAYALLDGKAFIEQEHLEAALEVWRYSEDSARHIWGAALGDPVADAILRVLVAAPQGMDRTAINAVFARHKNSGDIQRALDLLLDRGLARMEKRRTAGRPVELWCPI